MRALPPALAAARDDAGGLDCAALGAAIAALCVACPGCGATGARGLGAPRTFNLLFETRVGATAGGSGGGGGGCATAYLRPETAQGAYIHFLDVLRSTRRRLPFGVGQAGRSFRNEIATGQFLFRTREFDQAELQYFCAPAASPAEFERWLAAALAFLRDAAGLRDESVRVHAYAKAELAHYALATSDIEFAFPWGWDELWGVSNRGDFDLRAHSAASGVRLEYTDPVGGEARPAHRAARARARATSPPPPSPARRPSRRT